MDYSINHKKVIVKELLCFIKQNIDIEIYLLDYDYDKEPQREWFCNIISTFLPEKFDEFLSWALHKREKKFINQRGLKVNVYPQFVNIFSKSKNVSIFIGRSLFFWEILLKRKAYKMETDNGLLATAQSKIEELDNKISN